MLQIAYLFLFLPQLRISLISSMSEAFKLLGEIFVFEKFSLDLKIQSLNDTLLLFNQGFPLMQQLLRSFPQVLKSSLLTLLPLNLLSQKSQLLKQSLVPLIQLPVLLFQGGYFLALIFEHLTGRVLLRALLFSHKVDLFHQFLVFALQILLLTLHCS